MKGYRRPDGRVGVRNHVLILSTVGCANSVVRAISAAVPGAVAVSCAKGCGQIGTGIEIMSRCLRNLPQSPNVFGTLLVGLGCETTRPHELADRIRNESRKPLEVITIQECGGSRKAIDRGIEIAVALAAEASAQVRTSMSLADLVVGTNCGGSDATSGLAANPVIGTIANRVVNHGGTVLLGETTELIGAEDILAARASSAETAAAIKRIICGLEDSLGRAGLDFRDANPSPGNIEGGLTTLEEKTLGGVVKGGEAPISEVVAYGSSPREHGLAIMDTPGYDIESVSGMVAGGASVVLFSTGRGTPTGNPLSPVIKITGNGYTYQTMKDDIDFDASGIIDGSATRSQLSQKLYELLEAVCNGLDPRADQLGSTEFAIFHNCEIWCTCFP